MIKLSEFVKNLELEQKNKLQEAPGEHDEDSDAAKEAERLGLQHLGWGRYGKEPGQATHISKNGKLVALDAQEPNGHSEPSRRDEPAPDDIRAKVAKMSPADRFHRKQTLAKRGQGEFPGEKPEPPKFTLKFPNMPDKGSFHFDHPVGAHDYGKQVGFDYAVYDQHGNVVDRNGNKVHDPATNDKTSSIEARVNTLLQDANGNIDDAIKAARVAFAFWQKDWMKHEKKKGKHPISTAFARDRVHHWADVIGHLTDKKKDQHTGIPSMASMVPKENITTNAEELAQAFLSESPSASKALENISIAAQKAMDEVKSALQVGGLSPADEEGLKARLQMYIEALERVRGFAQEEEEGDMTDPTRYQPDQ